ncbi:MAG: MFS transporter [Bacillota bacterium]|nr:MFS transporter [Bacillota bacterium]
MKRQDRSRTAAGLPTLNYRQTLLIGFGFFGSSLIWSIYNAMVPVMLETRFDLSTTLIGIIMTIDNFFGVIFQPTVGILSDRTRTRIGRRLPWIAAGMPLSAFLFALLPFMSTLSVMMVLLVLFNFIMSLWRSPVIALMPDVTPKALRSKANGIINLMGGLGSVLAFLVGGLLAKLHPQLIYPFAMAAVVLLLALVMLLAFVREPDAVAWRREKGIEVPDKHGYRFAAEVLDAGLAEKTEAAAESELPGRRSLGGIRGALAHLEGSERRSLLLMLAAIFFWFTGYNAVETFFTLYAVNVHGLEAGSATMMLTAFSLMFMIFALPSGHLAERFGRLRLIRIGLVGLVVVFIPINVVDHPLLMLALLAVGGVFWACININSLPMVVELATRDSVGSFTGFYYFFSFSSAIVSPILFGWIRDLTDNYSTLFIYTPIAFALALLAMTQVRHGDNLELARKRHQETDR